MKKLFLLAFVVLCTLTSYSQQLFSQDLSTVDVDKLSDNEISYYYTKLQQSNISLDQAFQIASAKGMPADQIQKLRMRLLHLNGSTQNSGLKNNNSFNYGNSPDSVLYPRQLSSEDSISLQDEIFEKQIFGSELFSKSSLSFQPNLRIATPVNYQLGTDDQLIIDVFGYSEMHYQLTVNTEGNIYIPNVGPVYVQGLTVQQAAKKIKDKLSQTIYKAISSGNTDVQVSLGNIKSIQVTIVGEAKKPGTYTISSLSTVFNALYLCGGPNKNGSYRNIELLRGDKVISAIDLYAFLLSGNQTGNIGLKDQDVIRIPFYNSRVTVKGEVKRPAIYEILPGTALQQVLDYAGGFSDSAYRSSVKILSFTDRQKKVEDISFKDFSKYKLSGSDEIEINKTLDRFENRVQINGAVMRPGDFELTQGLTLKQLIFNADGLREDAFTERGTITRLQDNLMPQLLSFNVNDVLNNRSADILLKKEDVVQISSILDLKDSAKVSVQGQIRNPGVFLFKDSMSLKDLIFEAGGFTEAATGMQVEIASRVSDADPIASSTQIAKVIDVDAGKDLNVNDQNYKLHPFDLVIVRNNPGYFTQKTVSVKGEVLYPGVYVINSNDEKLSSIVSRAGGFKSTADPSAASLRRINLVTEESKIKALNIEKIAMYKSDTSLNASADSLSKAAVQPYDLIGINLNEVIAKPGISNDLIIEDGDVITVPKKNQAIKVRGEVLFPTQFAFEEDKSMKYYIDKAGGFSSNAMRRKSFVLGSNGNARKVKTFLFFKSYPSVFAGDEIFVPHVPDRTNKGLSAPEIVGITTGIASLASIIVLLINNLK